VPPGVVTTTSKLPAVPAGEVAAQVVADVHVTAVAGLAPNIAVVAPATNPVPVTVTTLPPPKGPALGLTAVTAGTGS